MNKKHHSFFYGWWVVFACFFINVFGGGAVHFGFTAFFEPIAREFGWSYAQVSFAASLRGMEMGLFSPVAGLAVDRLGPRKLIFIGTIFMSLGLILLSRINTLASFYGAFLLVSAGLSACIGVVPMAAVANWFRKKAGLATGIAVCGVAVGGLVVPLATLLISLYGWRTAMVCLGIGMLVIILPLSLLLRHKPEKYGYLPDGETAGETAQPDISLEKSASQEPRIGLKKVLASRTFWQVAITFMLSLLVIGAVVTHIMPYLSSIGIDRTKASILASAVPLVTIIGRVGFGWLGDRFNSKMLTAVTFVMISLGMLAFGLAATGGRWLLFPFIVLFGVGYGGTTIMTPVLTRDYFGQSNFGSVLGFVMGVMTLGQIVGPTLAGWVFDTWGSYQGAWLGLAALILVSTLVVLTVPRMGAVELDKTLMG